MQKTGELEKRNSFKNFDLSKLKRQKPPKDSSLETFREIKELSKIKDNPKFVEDNDDMMKVFGNFATKNNYKFPEKIVKDMALDAYDNVIKKLKFHFNRPRPKELAKEYGIKLNDIELKSMKTPSYPSGHSAQGALIANILSDKYPKAKKAFMQTAKNISDSRNIAHAHYKSDSDMGRKLGEQMYNHIKNKKNEKSTNKNG